MKLVFLKYSIYWIRINASPTVNKLIRIYKNSPLFKELRDYTKLEGKCGVCKFRQICGGSRARAFALTGDYMESESYCIYIPKNYKGYS